MTEKSNNGICIGKRRRDELYGTEYYYTNGQRIFVDDIYGEDCDTTPPVYYK